MTKQTTINKALNYLTTHTIKETAKKYGVSMATITNWKNRANKPTYASTETTFTTTERKTMIVNQIARLKVELGELTYNELTRAA